MMLTNLADILRGAGLKVHEEGNWKWLGHGEMSDIRGVLWHHTAGAASGWYPSLRVVRDGRPGLSGPLSQLGLARDGTWICIAAGRAWHAGSGYHPAVGSAGNNHLIGIEAENTGTGQAWPAEQLDSYRRGTAAILRHFGLGSDRVIGHKEWAPNRKIDPFGLDMNAERRHVQHYMNAPSLGDVKGFLMALNDQEQQNVHDWILDIHRFFYHPGHVPNRIDPKNKTTGINMIADMAGWTQPVLGHTMAARDAAQTAAHELTQKRGSLVSKGETAFTQGEYAVFSDKNDYDNAKRLEAVEAQLEEILTVLKAKG